MKEMLERAANLIQSIEYINVATVGADSQPWNTPVYARIDSSCSFYWSSWVGAQHSLNILENPKTFITIYDSTRKRGDNNRRCLYLLANAVEVTESEEVEIGCKLLYGGQEGIHSTDYQDRGVKRIYKAKPLQAWLNDKSEREVTSETVKMRIELCLEDLCSHIRARN